MTRLFAEWRMVFSLSIVLICAGCVMATEPLLMYDQTQYSEDEVAVLLPATDQGIYMVLEIDGETAGGSCFTGCFFSQPVHISPGVHRFETWNMQGPGFTSLTSTVTFDFETELEGGKFYRLRIKILPKERGEDQKYLVWWDEVDAPAAPAEAVQP